MECSTAYPAAKPLDAGSGRRMTRAKLWDLYFQVNKLKVWVFYLHPASSRVKRERRLAEYLAETWEEGGFSWEDKDIIYMGVVPFSRYEYVGESKLGLHARARTQTNQTQRRTGRQRL